MKTTKHTRTELPTDQLREILIVREERRRRNDTESNWRYAPDYPANLLPEERQILLAAPDDIAVPLYGMIFERGEESRDLVDLLWGHAYGGRYNPIRFASWQERHTRTEAALAYLLDTGLVTAGVEFFWPFKFMASPWRERWWKHEWETPLSSADIEQLTAHHLKEHIRSLTSERNWRRDEDCERSARTRRATREARRMYWRLIRRLPGYAHLPEEHPPETPVLAWRRAA